MYLNNSLSIFVFSLSFNGGESVGRVWEGMAREGGMAGWRSGKSTCHRQRDCRVEGAVGHGYSSRLHYTRHHGYLLTYPLNY